MIHIRHKIVARLALATAALSTVLAACTNKPVSVSEVDSATIERSHRYIRIKVPYNELGNADQKEMLRGMVKIVNDGLKNLPPQSGLTPDKVTLEQLDKMAKNDAEIDKYVNAATTFSQRYKDQISLNKEKVGGLFKDAYNVWMDMIGGTYLPTAYILTFGGKISANWHFGLDASGALALVVRPYKEIVIDRYTRQTILNEYRVDIAPLLVPYLAIGVGEGATAAGFLGVGAILGEMNKASDFCGGFAAFSGGWHGGTVGAFMSGGAMLINTNMKAIRNPYIMVGSTFGAGAQVAPFKAEAGVFGCPTELVSYIGKYLNLNATIKTAPGGDGTSPNLPTPPSAPAPSASSSKKPDGPLTASK